MHSCFIWHTIIIAITSGEVDRINPKYWAGTGTVYVKNDDGTMFVYAEIAVPSNLKVGGRIRMAICYC